MNDRSRPKAAPETLAKRSTASITPSGDDGADDVPFAVERALTDLVVEVSRGRLPWPLAESYVIEALDAAAGALLDESWARAREALYPEAVRAARAVRVGASYAERRARELAAAQPRPGDFRGRHLHPVGGAS